MDVSVKPGRNLVSVMLTQPTSQKGVAPPLPAPPLSSPGHGWHLVRDHNVTRHDEGSPRTYEAFQHRDHSVHQHHDDVDREDNVGYRQVNDARHHRGDVSPHHENDVGGPSPNSTRPPLQPNAHRLPEEQLLPLSLLKEALAPLCLRLAAVEAGLEQLLLHIPMLMVQGSGVMVNDGGAISKGRARRSPTKGVTPSTVTTAPVTSHSTCTSPLLKATASLTTPSILTCSSSLATATPSLATGKAVDLMCTLPLATMHSLATTAPCDMTRMLPVATGPHSLATGMPSHRKSTLPPATGSPSQATERAPHLTCGSDVATGTSSLAPGLPSLTMGTPLATEIPPLTMGMSSLRTGKLPVAMNSLQTTWTQGFSTMGEGLKSTEVLGQEGEEPAKGKRKWSFNGGHLDLCEPADGGSHLASGESAGLSSGQWEELKVCKKRRGCRDFPISCPSSSVVSSNATTVPTQRPIPPLHHSGNMLLPCGQSRLPLSNCLSQSVSSLDPSQSWPNGSTHHFMFVGDYPVCRTCPVDHCPPVGLSLVQSQKPRARSRQNILGSHSELHSKPVPSQSETSTQPPSQSKTSSTPPGQSKTSSTPSASQPEDLISWLFGSSFPASQSCFFTLRAPQGHSLTALPIKPPRVSMTTGRWLRPLHALSCLSPVAMEMATRCLLATAGQWPPRPPLRDRTAPRSLENDHSYGQRTPPLSSSVWSLSKCARQLKRSGAPVNELASIKAASPSPASAPGGRQRKTGEVKRVSQIRIRKSMPKRDAELTPMGLPRPKRLKKKEFSLEEIYTNQNYRSPSNNSLETIFEEPRERGGRVLCMAHQKRPRLLNFSHTSRPRRRRLGQAGSGLISTSSMTSAVTRRRCRANGGLTEDEDADVRLVERLSALEDFLSRSGLDEV